MTNSAVAIRPTTVDDKAWVIRLMEEHWGGDSVVVHGCVHKPTELPSFVAEVGGERVGLVTYSLLPTHACEIVTLNALREGVGVGGALIAAAETKAREASCLRLWLVTTNDNLGALRFYQRRGFRLVALRADAVAESRRVKPSIPLVGDAGVPIRDEIELELNLCEPPPDGREHNVGGVAKLIVDIESAALRRWGQGDPDGFIEISATDVVYFDPFVSRRIDGLPALSDYYNVLRGKIHFDGFEIVNPRVQLKGTTAVLTFNYVSTCDCRNPPNHSRWNCTEVFCLINGAWRIVQTHWSRTFAANT